MIILQANTLLWPIVKAFEDAVRDPEKVEYDGNCELRLTGKYGITFTIFMDCGEPDYIASVDKDGYAVDLVSCGSYIFTNLLSWYHDEVLDLAKQHYNWDYPTENSRS